MRAALLSEPPLPAAGEAPRVALPFRLHAESVEELLERLPPLVLPPVFDARHVRAVEPGELLSLTMLASSHGVPPPALPVPADALIAPRHVEDARDAGNLCDALFADSFLERLGRWGWRPADARRVAETVDELVRNAVEHARAAAWVAAWRTGPHELRVAVADAGIGFGSSLGVRDDGQAVLWVLHGGSRVPGRGQGLRRVAETVAGWGGWMRIRSRTAVLRGAAPWRDAELRDQLPFLPGVQLEAVFPSPPHRPGNKGLGTAPPFA